jgi:transposase
LISSDGDVPLLFKAHSGNVSDVTVMKERLDNLKACLKAVDADDLFPELLVADCKFYTQQTLEFAEREGTTWVTRVPDTISETDAVVLRALKNRGGWQKASFDPKISFQEFEVSKWDKQQRFFVVRTQGSKARIQKAMEKRKRKDEEALLKHLRVLKKQSFACLPDLKAAANRALEESQYFKLDEISYNTKSVQRGPGRPPKHQGTETFHFEAAIYEMDKKRVRQEELEDACFVIASNATESSKSGESILHAYLKDQQGVERGFRFLKSPSYFCDAFFLKNPGRVVALLCIMSLGLLLHSLLQRKARKQLELSKETVPDQKGRKTQKPTQNWINQKFEGLDVIKVRETDGTVWYKFETMCEFVKLTLRILGPPYESRYSPSFLN